MAGEEFRDDAKAIKVGGQAGADDRDLFSAIERGGAGEEPSGEEVSDRAHCPENGLSFEYLRGKTLPLMTMIGWIFTDTARKGYQLEPSDAGQMLSQRTIVLWAKKW